MLLVDKAVMDLLAGGEQMPASVGNVFRSGLCSRLQRRKAMISESHQRYHYRIKAKE